MQLLVQLIKNSDEFLEHGHQFWDPSALLLESLILLLLLFLKFFIVNTLKSDGLNTMVDHVGMRVLYLAYQQVLKSVQEGQKAAISVYLS